MKLSWLVGMAEDQFGRSYRNSDTVNAYWHIELRLNNKTPHNIRDNEKECEKKTKKKKKKERKRKIQRKTTILVYGKLREKLFQ